MKEEVLDYIRKHPVWYVTLCHYPECWRCYNE